MTHEDDSNRFLKQFSEFNNSSFSPVALDEYKKSLKEYNTGAENLEIGSTNGDAGQMHDAAAHIRNGTYYMNTALQEMSLITNKSKIYQGANS